MSRVLVIIKYSWDMIQEILFLQIGKICCIIEFAFYGFLTLPFSQDFFFSSFFFCQAFLVILAFVRELRPSSTFACLQMLL